MRPFRWVALARWETCVAGVQWARRLERAIVLGCTRPVVCHRTPSAERAVSGCVAARSIGDDGLSALVDAATTHGALATLKELHLNINRIGDVGVSTLADALTAGPAGVWEQLHTLNLQHNAIGQPGVEALSAALARGGLPSLRHLQWPATHLADASLVASCQGRSIQLG
jgi:hypothetical protein